MKCQEHGDQPSMCSKCAYEQIAKLRSMLESLQWSDGHWSVGHDGGGCPACGGVSRSGHRADCELAAVLRHGEEP